MSGEIDRNGVNRIIRDIYNSFDWETTSKGVEYWKDVVNSLKELVPEKPVERFGIIYKRRENKYILREKVAGKWRYIGSFPSKSAAEMAKNQYYG